MLAVMDGTLSSLLTCSPITPGGGGGAHAECTALGGPVLTTLNAITDFLDGHGEAVTALFTIVLAVFTARLWYSTESLFRVTKVVADADRPHMIPSEMTISGIRQPPAEDGLIKTILKYKFTNYGRSPAFMKRFCLMVRVASHELETVPNYGEPTNTDFIIVVNGWWGSIEADPSIISIRPEDAAEILSGTCSLMVLGFIEYDDPASQPHRMRFAYRLSFGEGDTSTQFRPTGPDTYREYT
jgi:hypothetical protein